MNSFQATPVICVQAAHHFGLLLLLSFFSFICLLLPWMKGENENEWFCSKTCGRCYQPTTCFVITLPLQLRNPAAAEAAGRSIYKISRTLIKHLGYSYQFYIIYVTPSLPPPDWKQPMNTSTLASQSWCWATHPAHRLYSDDEWWEDIFKQGRSRE